MQYGYHGHSALIYASHAVWDLAIAYCRLRRAIVAEVEDLML